MVGFHLTAAKLSRLLRLLQTVEDAVIPVHHPDLSLTVQVEIGLALTLLPDNPEVHFVPSSSSLHTHHCTMWSVTHRPAALAPWHSLPSPDWGCACLRRDR